MKFIIRDDDLNYFSTPADIERWYTDIFAKKIPVTFATIPFVKGTSDVYTANAPKEDKEYPISQNTTLISYLNSNTLTEVIQHGCTHETKNGVFEYASKDDLVAATVRGKAELERAFGHAITTFAPPHDWIGSSGIRGIEAAHLNVIRGRGAGLRNIIVRWQYLIIFVRTFFFKLIHFIHGHIPAYPHVLNFGQHKELCSYRLEDTDVFKGLEYTHKKNGIFVVVTHIHFYTEEKKARLLELINRAQALGVEFVKPSAIF